MDVFLFNVVAGIVLGIVDTMLGTVITQAKIGLLGSIYTLAVLLPGIAVAVRRLHDTGRSGWMALLWLVPCIGWIILLVFLVQEGNPGDNAYGPDPKASGDQPPVVQG